MSNFEKVTVAYELEMFEAVVADCDRFPLCRHIRTSCVRHASGCTRVYGDEGRAPPFSGDESSPNEADVDIDEKLGEAMREREREHLHKRRREFWIRHARASARTPARTESTRLPSARSRAALAL